jgi:predicted transcriptional regulator YdeE
MRLDNFVDSVRDAGWKNLGDAQHSEIEKLWRKMFPTVAELSDEITDLQAELAAHKSRQLTDSECDALDYFITNAVNEVMNSPADMTDEEVQDAYCDETRKAIRQWFAGVTG